ncbi:AAA family ATPase [Streptobacillus ratti]|uniref:AAA family ATPase n=1 Tax=Streptobacillus ratti TaxID=1720557 RepID=UPI000932E34A|nr:AAA family ATPase [Streptobacillus ratti]
MEIYLLNLTINGVKNIEKTISIDFYKKNISNPDFDNYRVKGIFGKNGVGKTAIIKSVEIVKNVVLNRKYLIKNERNIAELINKVSKQMEVEMEFYINDNNKLKILNHKMVIAIENDGLKIKYEHLKVKTLKNTVSKEIVQENGVFTIKGVEFEDDNIYLSNILSSNSFIGIFNYILNGKHKYNDLKEYINKLIFAYYYILTSFHDEDKYFNNLNLEQIKENIRDIEKLENDNKLSYDISVEKNSMGEFEKELDSITKFLKLFSSKIKKVNYRHHSQDEDRYYLNYVIEYDDYDISLDYESMGIKNLFKMYRIIKAPFYGRIVFIDEIDLSIHEVYLEKLIESVAEFSKGQLIFTAHNIGLLNVLNNYKNSINFIDANNNLQKWVQKGTLNPIKSYKEGRIENMAFNIEAYEFLEVFGEEHE